MVEAVEEKSIEEAKDEVIPKSQGDDEEDHDFEIINKEEEEEERGEGEPKDEQSLPQKQHHHQEQQQQKQHKGLWIGIDLGTSNCACAIWDSTRGRPKWLRLKDIAGKQANGKVGRIVPSAVQFVQQQQQQMNEGVTTADDALWEDICKWNVNQSKLSKQDLTFAVGQKAIERVQQRMFQQEGAGEGEEKEDSKQPDDCSSSSVTQVIKSMKRVLGVCYTTQLKDFDPELRQSLPFELEETKEGEWVVPLELGPPDSGTTLYLRPVHVAAILLQSIRHSAQLYLKRAIPKKNMKVPGFNKDDNDTSTTISNVFDICNVVVGVPAYYGQRQRQAVEEAARLAGYIGHVATLTESTAAAMAYGLFVGNNGNPNSYGKNAASAASATQNNRAVLVLDMGGGTTDITIAHMMNAADANDDAMQQQNEQQQMPDQKFQVILTDGDSRLGGEDMDQALLDLVMKKKAASGAGEEQQLLTSQQRQQLLRSCQHAKELLCGDVDHDDPPAESATVQLLPPSSKTSSSVVELTQEDLDQAIQPILDRTALLMERTLKRYADKLSTTTGTPTDGSSSSSSLIAEAILIGGATRVPALRQMLMEKFFPDIELCVSVNAMSSVAQGTAIQAAIISQQVPLHELRSAMMLDTTPHAIGALLKTTATSGGGDDGDDEQQVEHRFVQVLPRDSPLPAQGYATFYVADLDQKGVTVTAVERIEAQPQPAQQQLQAVYNYQPLGEFNFLLHRLTPSQRDAIRNDKDHPGLRPVDIGMSLGTDGAFHVTIFDPNDPDHQRKKEFYQKSKQDVTFEAGMLDYVQAAADLKDGTITVEEMKLIVVVAALFIFYIVVKVLLSKEDILSEEDMARIL